MLHVEMNQVVDYEIQLKTEIMSCVMEGKDYFEKMTLGEFNYHISQLMDDDNNYDFQCFMYHTILHLHRENIQGFINDDSVPIEFLERIFIFSYSLIYDRKIESVIDNVLSCVSEERLLKLIEESEYLKNNKMLLFYLSIRINLDKLTHILKKH